jgi:hypothetical protein
MSGSKTRYGFAGGSDPPDAEESRSARTVLGHDVHLQMPGSMPPPEFPRAPTPIPPAPPPRSPVPATRLLDTEDAFEDTNPRRLPKPPRQSRLARFLGRWTDSGRFESRSRIGFDSGERIGLPRDTTARNVLLVLLVAVLTFSVTFVIVRLHQRTAGPPAASQTPAAPPAPAHYVPGSPSSPTSAATPSPAGSPQAQSVPASKGAAPLPPAARGLGYVPPPSAGSHETPPGSPAAGRPPVVPASGPSRRTP